MQRIASPGSSPQTLSVSTSVTMMMNAPMIRAVTKASAGTMRDLARADPTPVIVSSVGTIRTSSVSSPGTPARRLGASFVGICGRLVGHDRRPPPRSRRTAEHGEADLGPRCVATELGRNPSLVHHENSIGQGHDLLELGGNDEHGGAVSRSSTIRYGCTRSSRHRCRASAVTR